MWSTTSKDALYSADRCSQNSVLSTWKKVDGRFLPNNIGIIVLLKMFKGKNNGKANRWCKVLSHLNENYTDELRDYGSYRDVIVEKC